MWEIEQAEANSRKLKELLRANWEPFAVTPPETRNASSDYSVVWLRRPTKTKFHTTTQKGELDSQLY